MTPRYLSLSITDPVTSHDTWRYCRCFSRHEADFALQAHVECRVFETQKLAVHAGMRKDSEQVQNN